GKFREDSQAETVGSEVYFGPNERLRAKIAVGGEPGVEFAGRIDRVDLRHSLNQMVVIDYKSGKSSQYKISPDNPTQNGRNLQLAIYATSLSEMEQTSELTPELLGEYLFTAPSEEARRISLELTDEVRERVALVVKSIVQAIWDGSFPQGLLNPSANPIGCEYCDPSNLRPRWHNQQIKAKLTDQVISSFADLVYPDDVRNQDDN
ncbi:ATP-dependent nuclease subunit B-like protein, partial [mine drainage metagenome]